MANTFDLYQDPSGNWAGPKRHQVQRLFRYLGLRDPGERRGFKAAARGGTLTDFFTGRPTSAGLLAQLMGQAPPSDWVTGKPNRAERRAERLRQTGAQFGYVGKFNPAAIPPVPTDITGDRPPNTPGPPAPAAPGAGPAPAVPQTIEDMLAKLGGYAGPLASQTSQFIQNRLGGGLDLPSFENMFQNLLDVHNREGNKNIAALNEAMGSRGARYGSDILNAQADMRRQQTQDLAQQADQLALALGQQQQGMLGLQQQGAQMEQAARENALSRMFQEYLMQSQLPPIFQSMIAGLNQLPQRDTLSYVG